MRFATRLARICEMPRPFAASAILPKGRARLDRRQPVHLPRHAKNPVAGVASRRLIDSRRVIAAKTVKYLKANAWVFEARAA